jgi:hypothetical protein
MYWDRLPHGGGRGRLVGTPVKTAETLPKALLAAATPRWLQSARGSIAPTAGQDGLFGAAVSPSASQPALQRAYGVCAKEAPALEAEDAPHTVNPDGWPATQGAWKALWPQITLILCLLHALLTIRDRATPAVREVFEQVQDRGWETSHAPSPGAFSQRVRRLREGAERG